MSVELIGLAGVVLLLLLIALRVPISFAMMLVGIIGFSMIRTPSAALSMASSELFSTFSSYSLSVIPMFIWMGYIAYYSGVGTSLYQFAYKMVGHKRGGLAIATQAACALFGAICGSNTATAATIGAIALPEMRKYGYNDSLSTASVAAGGALGVLIPPSVIFIVYGIATEQSVGKLFFSGIIPGILLMLFYMLTIYIIVRRNPEFGPAGAKSGWKERIDALRGGLLEVILTFCISLGGLFAGWFTPTEAGAVGAVSIFVITLIRRRLSWEGFKKSLMETTRTTAMIMLMVAGAMIFGRFIAVSRLPAAMATWASGLNLPPVMVLMIILMIYALLGCIIDALALILLTIPIFYPVAVNVLGYNPIWFGVVIVLVVALGVITPPVGMNVFVIKGVVPDVPLEKIFKGVWPFVAALIACIIVLILFPQLVLFLPDLLM
ncbi:MAG TPA: TRAP transporter large permease [Clostridiaceae bacterium]|nr:TRAP transporter large permease [Clostridiaceae bacterium]